MRTIRWGIVGCGEVTEVKSGPGFYKCRRSELVAVMRRDGGKAADYARRHGVRRWYDDADRLIGDAEVDAVYVATPPGTHEFYAMKVLAAGKACYVEKPMARNGSEARRMVEGFRAKGVPLFVAYYRRALPRFLKVREILGSGVLGEKCSVSYTYSDGQMRSASNPAAWRFVPERSGGGLFLDLGSHMLDLMDFFFGPAKLKQGWASSSAEGYRVESSVVVECEHGNGTRVRGLWNFKSEKKSEGFIFDGENGAALYFSCFGNEPVVLRHEDGREERFDLPNPEHVGMPMIQTAVNDLLGTGKCESTGESGLRTQVVMDAVLEKYYGGREDGFWLREWPKG
ncbi:MAG: Gfo/Idh/MocA family protein [Phycisphaerae bacterium]